MLPAPFLQTMRELLDKEGFDRFVETMRQQAPVSIRLNPSKQPKSDIGDGWGRGTAKVPWHPWGLYLPERPVFTLDPSFHAGAYYVQEASSMFLHEALRQTVDFSEPLRLLDLCAAPGGKSTLLADLISPESLLVANEAIRPRVAALRENLEKWGAWNIAVTHADAGEYAALEDWFDVVVADAPCSGEGLFRKDPDSVREWSPAHVEMCSVRQRHILAAAVATLRPGGVLAYSTCTFNATENEGNVDWLLKTFPLERLTLEIPADWGITASAHGYRFFPHKLRGEGFFMSILRKKDGIGQKHRTAAAFKNINPLAKGFVPEISRWLHPDTEAKYFQTPSGEMLALPARLENEYLVLDKFLKTKWFGTMVGELKGKDFVPSHALALSRRIATNLPALDLEREQALRFLKKETFELPSDTLHGWALARYEGLNLGWVKVLPGRMNNYLPPERRIRMSLDAQ